MLPKRLIAFSVFAALAVMPTCVLHAQWVQTNGLDGKRISCLAVNGTVIFVGTSGEGVFRSTDIGLIWVQVNSGLGNLELSTLAVSGNVIFAGTTGGWGDRVYLSKDSGASWISASGNLPKDDIEALFTQGTNVFVSTFQNGVFRSTDGGFNWFAVDSGLESGGIVLSFAGLGTNLFAGCQAGVFRSTDSGTSWAKTGLTNATVLALAVLNTNLFAGPFNVSNDSGGVSLSTDNGTHWTAVNKGLPDGLIVGSFLILDKFIFIASGNGIYLTTDNGSYWMGMNTGLSDTAVCSLGLFSPNLFAGISGSGVWRRPLSEMIAQNAVAEPTANNYGVQSYPNPFSQSTTISFTPDASGHADVSVVNLLGVEVARIFSGELAAGEHRFTWDAATGGSAAADATGVYECLVRMNGRIEELPIMLMR